MEINTDLVLGICIGAGLTALLNVIRDAMKSS